MKTGHIRLDVLIAWPQFGPPQHYVFDYIDAMNHTHGAKVNAKRDAKGRPWICIRELCEAVPSIKQGPHTVALWIREMAKAGLLDRVARKVVVPGVGVRTMVWARPSQLYEDKKFAIDQMGVAAYADEVLPRFKKNVSRVRARNIGGHRCTTTGRTPVSLNTKNNPNSSARARKEWSPILLSFDMAGRNELSEADGRASFRPG
jgi:hypothetical protein